MEIEYFINHGYGWLCKHCHKDDDTRAGPDKGRARFFSEGESEDKEPRLSSQGLARWRDSSRQTLFCPGCGIEEVINKA